MNWHDIDIGPAGKAGIEARVATSGTTVYLYIHGSDHRYDWLHHIRPGAARREIGWGRQLFDAIYVGNMHVYVIGGHSLGGAVAQVLATLLVMRGAAVELHTYGGKRPPNRYDMAGSHYRHRGDVVPWLNILRPNQPRIRIGNWTWPWVAHGPRTYYHEMEKAGLR